MLTRSCDMMPMKHSSHMSMAAYAQYFLMSAVRLSYALILMPTMLQPFEATRAE